MILALKDHVQYKAHRFEKDKQIVLLPDTSSPSTVSLEGPLEPVAFLERKRIISASAPAHCPTDMALAKSVYNLLFRRTSTFAITIMVGAVFFERLFDQGGDAIFEQMNRGVSASFGVLNVVLS